MHRFQTTAVHAGREDFGDLCVHAPPLDLSTTYPIADLDVGSASFDALVGGHASAANPIYARLHNPTVARAENAIAALEGTQACVAYASGMAAMTAVLLDRAQHGKHVLVVRPLYGTADHLLATGMCGLEAEFVKAEDIAARLRPDTALVVIETPANPTLNLVDIRAVVAAAGSVPVLVDSTFATPVLQRPAELGAAYVLHSATKFLGGHGDVIAGVVACDAETAVALRRVRTATGGILHPLGGYLLHRGLTTLPVRMRAQQENARRVAAFLAEHPAVARVYYPELDADARRLLGTEQSNAQLRGPGAMVSMALTGGFAAAERFAARLRVFTHAVSLGGVDSLVQHPAAISHRHVAPEARPGADIVRLSIGLEAADDLIADLGQALA